MSYFDITVRILKLLIRWEIWGIVILNVFFGVITVAMADCHEFEQLSREAITKRQAGVKIQYDARNQMEQEMLNSLFQYPAYRGDSKYSDTLRQGVINRFTETWTGDCKRGRYN